MRLEETLSIYILHILQHTEIDGNSIAVLPATREERRKIMTANISDLQHIASNLIAGGWTSKDAKEIQLEYNLCDDEVNALVEIMEEMKE